MRLPEVGYYTKTGRPEPIPLGWGGLRTSGNGFHFGQGAIRWGRKAGGLIRSPRRMTDQRKFSGR